ncbi:MAG TPA: L-histidine N(alpha)-methyltransferase [Candidatus Bathyarchaeia archaeon]|nr:L-histidine N(alpha)-methyltransferase [Candidatus Bathyarchaeia archaeon]
MSIRYRAIACTNEVDNWRTLREDVRAGLTGFPRSLPPKYFYDATGSKLFEDITELPEYYLTRTEAALLAEMAPALMRELGPADIVEIGSGSAVKTRQLLDAREGMPQALRYVPIDLDGGMLEMAAGRLLADYPFLHVEGLVGDFQRDLRHVPAAIGRRLMLLLGSTIGNLDAPARRRLLVDAHGLLSRDDRFLIGLDLVKDVKVLEAAYDDASGVTREFNRNILRVVNRGVDADFDPAAFQHVAFYDEAASRIEMHLVPESPQEVHLRALDLTIRLAPGDGIWTESCYKFSRASTQDMLEDAGFRLAHWHVDPANYFALAVAAPA